MTGQEIFENAMMLIDETKDNGQIDVSGSIAYANKAVRLINMVQYELYKDNNKIKTFEINLNHVEPVVGLMETKIHDKEDVILLESNKACNAYYLEVRGNADIYIDEYINGTWTVNSMIQVTNISQEFVICKEKITVSEIASKTRIRCSGSYMYYVCNFALYDNNFYSNLDIPDYKENIRYEFPTNYMKIKSIMHTSIDNVQKKLDDFSTEANKYIYISRKLNGKALVQYIYAPKRINSLSEELDVDDITAYSIIPYGLASKLVLTENRALASSLDSMYMDLKQNLSSNNTAENIMIEDTIGTSLVTDGSRW